MSIRQGDGAPLRTHLQRAAANGGKPDALLDAEPLPFNLRVIWDTYAMLSHSRPAGMGMSPISQVEIRAWCDNFSTPLSPWEIETIIEMDSATMSIVARNGKAPQQEA